MRNTCIALFAIGCAISGHSVLAHHSAAMFDRNQEISASGTVKDWLWTNPHSWLTVMIDDGHGNLVAQPLELGSPNTLFRSGWRIDTFVAGDKVTVVYHPRKDNVPGGALVKAETAEGKWMTWLPSEKPANPSPDGASTTAEQP